MSYSKSIKLFERASNVIPGGIYGHTSPAISLPQASPYYAKSAKGCHYEDVDGNRYIDFLCAYGPVILGYGHPEVEEATAKQRRDGDCFNHPTELMVTLAEELVSRVDFAGWTVFGKNGSDMTTWALQVAREYTGNTKVLLVEGAYHGKDPWCTPSLAGVIESDRQHVHSFPWNDVEAFTQLVKKHRNQIAALFITPYHHPAYADSVMPAEGFFKELEKLCRKEGIIIILDDVRAGFRLDIGGSHKVFGITPDIGCYSKAIGNGYPISAAVGSKDLKAVASKVFLTGSFWGNAVPMAAALKTLEIIERDQVPQQLEKVGKQFSAGLKAIGERLGHPMICSGPPAIPFARFAEDSNFRLQQKFCTEVIKRGVYLHPHHNWFLSTAHTEAIINEALKIIEQAAESIF